jgi:hypothetical protein
LDFLCELYYDARIHEHQIDTVFSNNHQGRRLRGQLKTDGGTVCEQINSKLITGKRFKKNELTGRSPLRRHRSAMDCSAISEEEKKNS